MYSLYPWQSELQKKILHIIHSQCIPHAWMITGSEGVGINELGLYLAGKLFCQQTGENPCGICSSCILFEKRQHPDFYYLKEADKEQYNVQAIRQLRDQLLSSAQQGASKVVLIETAEKLTLGAANGLLKIMEEPPSQVYFILLCAQPSQLPITIRSRCAVLHCSIPAQAFSLPWLQQESALTDSDCKKALQLAYGAPLTALALLKNPALLKEHEQAVNDFLSLMQGKQSPLALAASWSQKQELHLFSIIEFCLRKIIRQETGAVGSNVGNKNVTQLQRCFALYDELLLGHRRLLLTPGLNRQLFWEHFLLQTKEYATC